MAQSSPAVAQRPEGYDVWLLVGKTFHKVERTLNGLLADLDLTVAQHEILAVIGHRPGLNQKQLADHLSVVKSNVSSLLKKLESRGLIRRREDPDDVRNKRLELTPEGRRLLRRSLAQQDRVVTQMMSTLDSRDLDSTRSVMERVGRALDALERR